MRWIAAVLFLVATLPSCAINPGKSPDSPLDTTIAAVRANGPQYDGKYVRVRGLLNQCIGFSCVLHPVAKNGTPDWKAPEFRIAFSRDAPNLMLPEDFEARSFLGYLYRFSEITIVGQYDYTCDSANDPHPVGPGGLQDVVICTDAATNFADVRVVAVHKRWPSTAFSIWPGKKLSPLPPPLAETIIAAFKENRSANLSETNQYHVLNNPEDATSAYLCVCLENSCAGKWPTQAPQVLGNPANPYVCAYASLDHGTWHFAPQDF